VYSVISDYISMIITCV